MAIFNKSDKMAKGSSSTTIISTGAKIEGDFQLSAQLHIEGEMVGKIESSNQVSIGEGGVVKGELKAEKLIVNGSFEGKAECETIEIMKGGILKGDIIIKHIVIEEGGVFEGSSTIKTTNQNGKKMGENIKK
jgi:cytoskeletal protein CcmA (bactofilin family)